MAQFQKNTTHPDTVPKRRITGSDLAFLDSLQHTLNTQDTMGNADPRFWVIKQSEWQLTANGNHDAIQYYDEETGMTIRTPSELSDYFDCHVEYDVQIVKDGNDEWNISICDFFIAEAIPDTDDLETFVPEDLDEYIEDNIRTLQKQYVERVSVIVPDTLFLTHKACEDHLRRYGYNYAPDAHAYCMTATRSPEYETLLRMLQTVDWTDVAISIIATQPAYEDTEERED